LFALSNIERVELLGITFTRRRGFSLQAYAERSFGVIQEKKAVRRGLALFRQRRLTTQGNSCFIRTQKLEDQPDGSLIVRFRAGGALEMCWHLFTWGNEVEVLAPPHLRNLLRELTIKARPRAHSPAAAARKISDKRNVS
jgi:predicted DNA-binding transcriptional regulator YafY